MMKFVDAHSDFGIRFIQSPRARYGDVMTSEHLPMLKSGGVALEVMTVGGDFAVDDLDLADPVDAFRVIEAVLREEEHAEAWQVVRNRGDLQEIANGTGTGLLLHIEGAALLRKDLALLKTFYRLGVRSFAFTHNLRNDFGDGCLEPSNGGFSLAGRKVLKELAKLPMVLDLAHAGERLFEEAAASYPKPFVTSHAGVKGITDHPRNLSDHQLRLIRDAGGVLGVALVAAFIHTPPAEASIDSLLDHICYAAERIGSEHIGIGPDFTYFYPEAVERLRERLGMDPGTIMFPPHLDSPAGFPLLAEALSNRGFSQSEIQGICGENLIRLFGSLLQ
jgi:membrane dipeptidase